MKNPGRPVVGCAVCSDERAAAGGPAVWDRLFVRVSAGAALRASAAFAAPADSPCRQRICAGSRMGMGLAGVCGVPGRSAVRLYGGTVSGWDPVGTDCGVVASACFCGILAGNGADFCLYFPASEKIFEKS